MNIGLVKSMIEDGFAIKRIAVKNKFVEEDVRKLVKEKGWAILKEPFSGEQIDRIKLLYSEGVSAKNLGIKFSIDKRRIQKWAKESGTLRDKNDSHRFVWFNYHAFDVIDTPEAAYWLGFLYADAYNCDITNSVKLCIKEADTNHLVKLANFVKINPEVITHGFVTLTDEETLEERKYPVCALHLYSKHLCTKLTELGCPRAKSFIIKYPHWLRDVLHVHFIRGLFDGDGCISLRKEYKEWKWSLMSTKECCEGVQEMIFNATGTFIDCEYASNTGNNTYILTTNGNEKICKIMDWLQKDSVIEMRLDRKHDKYLQLVEQQNNRMFLKHCDRTTYFKEFA